MAKTQCYCCGETYPGFLLVTVRNDGTSEPTDIVCANCQLARKRSGSCPHEDARRQEAVEPFDRITVQEIAKADPAAARIIHDSRRVHSLDPYVPPDPRTMHPVDVTARSINGRKPKTPKRKST